MPDLLLELFSEEIPARMQRRAADDLRRLMVEGLGDRGLGCEAAVAFATPRRLVLHMQGVPERAADAREERKGPRVGAPEQALQGFLRAAGLASIDQAQVVSDPKKGDFYTAVIEKPGLPAPAIIAGLVPEVIRAFPWPKSMRWGEGALRWVRPLHAILCLFDGEAVVFDVDGIASGNVTRGHRFMAPDAFAVSSFADYRDRLRDAFVIIDPQERARLIEAGARAIAGDAGLELVEDEALLAEAAGLVEWPVPLMGRFDEAFLDIPDEAVRTTIRANQKCFVLREPETGRLADRFIMVANLVARDGGKAIIAGNERVIAARLADARFFYEQDLAVPLAERVGALKDIIFHDKLGSQGERVERIEALASELAPLVGADADKARRAAHLAKADLVTAMVGEFPELQGVMGRDYALKQGEDEAVAAAIEQHYKPQGPSDSVPSEPVAIAVALADKLDMLTGFWTNGEKPTGSKDPYALRRAALGVIRTLLENGLRLPLFRHLRDLFIIHIRRRIDRASDSVVGELGRIAQKLQDPAAMDTVLNKQIFENAVAGLPSEIFEPAIDGVHDLLAFFHDRLKVHLREQGARHDLIDAVISSDTDDLLMIVRRVEALRDLLGTDDGRNLLAGVKRAVNILRIEERKDGRAYDDPPQRALLREPAERELADELGTVALRVDGHVAAEDFAAAMRAIARLRPAVDAFFDHVTVNAEDAALRANRLALLAAIRRVTLKVADFSHIEG